MCIRVSYYEPGTTWEDYRPAYRYGWESRTRYPDKTWEEVESDLERGWDESKAESRLAWERAKHASRDAWGRIEQSMANERIPR
ncbi:MAG: hypothetical protein IRY99_20280, partial [Isosphaeraceae bacterium]|nr:hypothetical protein [Isosphaeraceae bacterium]